METPARTGRGRPSSSWEIGYISCEQGKFFTWVQVTRRTDGVAIEWNSKKDCSLPGHVCALTSLTLLRPFWGLSMFVVHLGLEGNLQLTFGVLSDPFPLWFTSGLY